MSMSPGSLSTISISREVKIAPEPARCRFAWNFPKVDVYLRMASSKQASRLTTKAQLPDPQNSGAAGIVGASVPIVQVGISNFRIPLTYLDADGRKTRLETSVTGTVSLGADHKGINMSRIMRTFYRFEDRIFDLALLEEILIAFKEELASTRARLKLSFSYPIRMSSLRSGLSGYQYYEVAFEGTLDDLDRFRKVVHFDFVYSSACPCASDLSEHARETRGVYAIPHSQRSKARVMADVTPGCDLPIADLREHCAQAFATETQVMVKREDEQAFAELNGANIKFVEDAARLIYEELNQDRRIRDFQVAIAHLESLHSHDAVAVITKGIEDGFEGRFDDFGSLVC